MEKVNEPHEVEMYDEDISPHTSGGINKIVHKIGRQLVFRCHVLSFDYIISHLMLSK